MKTLLSFVLFLSVCAVAKEVKSTFQATIVKDGEATDLIYNYLDPDSSGKDVWTMTCVEQPCHLFRKGETVTLMMSDKFVRVRTGKETKRFLIGKICGAPTGCFKAALQPIK